MDDDRRKKGLWSLIRRVPRAERFRLSWPTRITIMRILLIAPFVGCMLNTHDPQFDQATQGLLRYAAVALFFLMAISDAIDGYWARSRKQITKLGTFLDPLADKLLMTCASLLLVSEQGHVDGWQLPSMVVVLIIGKDILITLGFLIVYLITSQIHIVPVRAGKLATALQLSMVIAVLVAPELAAVTPGYRWFVRVLWWSAAGMAVLAALIYIRNGTRYIEQYERTQTVGSGH